MLLKASVKCSRLSDWKESIKVFFESLWWVIKTDRLVIWYSHTTSRTCGRSRRLVPLIPWIGLSRRGILRNFNHSWVGWWWVGWTWLCWGWSWWYCLKWNRVHRWTEVYWMLPCCQRGWRWSLCPMGCSTDCSCGSRTGISCIISRSDCGNMTGISCISQRRGNRSGISCIISSCPWGNRTSIPCINCRQLVT